MTILIINLKNAPYKVKQPILSIFEQVNSHIFIATCSTRIRIEIWNLINENMISATLIYPVNTEKGYEILKIN